MVGLLLIVLLSSPMVPDAGAQGVPAEPGPVIQVAAPGVTQQLELNDGTRAIGRVEAVANGRVTFRTLSGVVMEVDVAAVRSVGPVTGSIVNGEFWPADSNPTRLFFAPTGRSLKKGEAYFGVYEILLPFVQVGITDRLSVGGGSPLFFGADLGDRPFWFSPKIEVVRGRRTHVSVGALHFLNMGDYSAGIAYAVATHGTADAALTVGGGYAYSSNDKEREGAPVVMVGGEKRVSRRFKVVTENYWFSNVGLVSGGFRYMGERFAADLGLVAPLAGDDIFVFPMLNFVWKIR